METTVLGRTGLRVSRMGVGAGGPSQIGRRTGLSPQASADLLRRAFDAGVNLVDSSEGYGTEEIIGAALEGRERTRIVLSTKKSTRHERVTPASLRDALDASLRRLGTDHIDIYNLHGVVPDDYGYLVEQVYPALDAARQQGKVRFVGITEMFTEDPGHAMLQRALADDLWDVVMVGFNLLNQTARTRVLAPARRQDVGVQVMFAVRKALATPERLDEFLTGLAQAGEVEADLTAHQLLEPLLAAGHAVSLPDAAYRFCRDEPGVHAVLSGTGNAEHLQANLASFGRPPLPEAHRRRLRQAFDRVTSATGQQPG